MGVKTVGNMGREPHKSQKRDVPTRYEGWLRLSLLVFGPLTWYGLGRLWIWAFDLTRLSEVVAGYMLAPIGIIGSLTLLVLGVTTIFEWLLEGFVEGDKARFAEVQRTEMQEKVSGSLSVFQTTGGEVSEVHKS